MPRSVRLTRRRDILTVIREGRRIRTTNFDVRILASPFGHSRIGVIVPKHQRTAVERNRLKRRLRELVRVDLLPALGADRPLDIAIRAQSDAYRATFPALRQEMQVLLEKIRNNDPDRS